MYAVIRTYSGPGAKQLFTEFEKHKSDIEELIRGVQGLVSYSLVNTGDGGVSVTVCRDKSGADESIRVAADWVKKNFSNVKAGAPTVNQGAVVVQIQ